MSVQVAAPTTVSTLHDLLWERHIKALDIKRRLHVIRAFAEELDRVRRGKPFRKRNDIVWHAMLDVRDKLPIDLYSLTVEMRHGIRPPNGRAPTEFMAKRGMFIEIRDHHCAKLTRTYVARPGDDEYLVALHTESRAKCFNRLFPSCTTDAPSPADVEDLCERFRVRMKPLREDRNKNRAHALEGDAGTVKMLWLPEFAELFDYVAEVVEDLSLVSEGSSFEGDNLNHANCDETAADMVDLILLGHISNVRDLTTTRTRDELYTRLHEIDDADPSEKTGFSRLHFNDRQFGPPFEDWHVVLAQSS